MCIHDRYRNAIAAAKISGIVEDLNLSDSEFQLCVSILFIGWVDHTHAQLRSRILTRYRYIIMQVPSNMFPNKIGRPSLYLPGCMIIWVCRHHPKRAKIPS